ncbi:MAG: hypothetical protein ACD_81C00183G0001 [uncultured bacterium]|nr:MAG: hypothetical protein ACD_81C00183G0001 [uncultured bacterium]HBI25189.1 hypothetical protein [Candidatus Wolfebacteria bacterium]
MRFIKLRREVKRRNIREVRKFNCRAVRLNVLAITDTSDQFVWLSREQPKMHSGVVVYLLQKTMFLFSSMKFYTSII